jgi:hypothetical protein
MYIQYLYFKKEESKYFRSFYIYYTTEFLKILLFQIKKPFSKKPKGLEWSGSPYWKALELLREILQLKMPD